MEKIECRFKQFRDKNLFVDCIFTIPYKPEIKCHRIVLSKYSSVFKELFSKIPYNPHNIRMHVPFNTQDNCFEQVINFMYSNNFTLNANNCIGLLAHSVVYGIESLEIMIKDMLDQKINNSNVLGFLKAYKAFSLAPENMSKYPLIAKNFNRLLDEASFLTDLIAANIKTFPIKKIYDACNPRLLSMILAKANLPDKEKITIINGFVGNQTLSEKDCKTFTSIIDWSTENSYKYLLGSDSNWVLPSVSRSLYSKIITQRRKSARAFENKICSLQGSKFQNWFAFAWLTVVSDSDGDEKTPEVELAQFIGTLGGLANFVNPVKYNLLTSLASDPLHPEFFSASYMFEDSPNYFLSMNQRSEGEATRHLFFGFSMRHNFFRIKAIKVVCDNMERGKPMSGNAKLFCKKPKKMKLLLRQSGSSDSQSNKFIPPELVELDHPFNCQNRLVCLLCVKSNEEEDPPHKKDRLAPMCLRISRLYTYGSFDAE